MDHSVEANGYGGGGTRLLPRLPRLQPAFASRELEALFARYQGGLARLALLHALAVGAVAAAALAVAALLLPAPSLALPALLPAASAALPAILFTLFAALLLASSPESALPRLLALLTQLILFAVAAAALPLNFAAWLRLTPPVTFSPAQGLPYALLVIHLLYTVTPLQVFVLFFAELDLHLLLNSRLGPA